jgi:hypothetical protein
LTLEDRRNRTDLVNMLKISRRMSAVLFEDFFELYSEGKTRGHLFGLEKLRFNTDLRKFSALSVSYTDEMNLRTGW